MLTEKIMTSGMDNIYISPPVHDGGGVWPVSQPAGQNSQMTFDLITWVLSLWEHVSP